MDNLSVNTERKYLIAGIIIFFIFIYTIRLFIIQVWDDKYQLIALNNSQRHVTQYPSRGLIYDRNGKLLVSNKVAYDLMIIPKQVSSFDTLLFIRLLKIDKAYLLKHFEKSKQYSRYKPSVFLKQISAKQYATFQEKMYKFSGFYVQNRTLRYYNKSIAAHLLGYVGEANNRMLKRDSYYESGDYIGISGIEKIYEKRLRGEKGEKIFLVDVHNRIKESFANGEYDTPSKVGENLTLSIDADLQEYGEKLMQGKIGSIVAIEPSTGEILAILSSPSYNPNLLVGRSRSKNYTRLSKNKHKPLFNRAVSAQYPPGSVFKIANALIALQADLINENANFICNKSLLGCHNHPPNNGVEKAIQYSCNPYFYQVYKRIIQQNINKKSIFKDSRIGLEFWQKSMFKFGFGKKIETDLSNIRSGKIPSVTYYDKIYGKNRWAFSTIYSNAIGQGEVMTVPLQIANFAATLANRGYYRVPHLLKNSDSLLFKKKQQTNIDKHWYDIVIQGMYNVVNAAHGTAGRARIDSIVVCGKTGTVQNPHGKDHSVFMAFAPRENPKIAIAVYVENSGFGGTWAAPITALMIEKYINREISEKNKKYKEKIILDYTPLWSEKKEEHIN